MHRILVVSGLVFGLTVAMAAAVHAQDIVGLSLRATGAMPSGTGRGTLDIVKSNGASNYLISVDFAGAAESLELNAFEGAEAWVVWAVDMDGIRHNLGTLNAESALKDIPVDYMVARVYLTAEPDAATKAPTGEPLFSVTLRNVTEVDTLPADAPAAAAATAPAGTTAGAAAGAATAPPTAAAPAGTAKDSAKPKELPTTGTWVQDVLAALAVATALIIGGWRLRMVRV